MIQTSTLSKALALVAFVLTSQTFAQNIPTEKKVLSITRNSSTDSTIMGTLSKNIFRTEEYQANYTVQVPYEEEEEYTIQVPYEATETYSEEVPYTATETYEEEVPYTETETYTEEVPYTVEIPYTDYVTEYRSEQVCRDVTSYRQQCHNEVKCYLVPGQRTCREVEECGTNAHGQPICKKRQVCEDGSSSQRCEDQRVCENVPFTDRECTYQQVPYQREVTKYRSETRYKTEYRTRNVTKYRTEYRTRTVTKYRTEYFTRTVTKYRTETRTRTVTKMRDETRCCVTKTREVFDRQLQYQVSVTIPQGAVLLVGEVEKLNINLVKADDTTAEVSLTIADSVFGYKIAEQTVSGATLNIVLEVAPKWDLTNAGASSIKNLQLVFNATSKKFQLSFTDSILSRRVASSFKATVFDSTNKVLEEQILKIGAKGAVTATLTSVTDKNAKIKVVVQGIRTGLTVVDTKINFDTNVAPTKPK